MEMFIRQLDLSVNDKNTKPVLLNLLTKFLAQLKANNNMQKTEYDFRKHFQNWCRKQNLNEYLPKTETKTNNQTIEELNAKYSKKYTQET